MLVTQERREVGGCVCRQPTRRSIDGCLSSSTTAETFIDGERTENIRILHLINRSRLLQLLMLLVLLLVVVVVVMVVVVMVMPRPRMMPVGAALMRRRRSPAASSFSWASPGQSIPKSFTGDVGTHLHQATTEEQHKIWPDRNT